MNRREFLHRVGFAGLVATIGQLPAKLDARAIQPLAGSGETDGDVVRETISGLVAFVVPGDDAFSDVQGERLEEPGGIAADSTQFLIDSLDGYLPAPDGPGPLANDATVPLSGVVAGYLNTLALQVAPVAAVGPFRSAFANLSVAEKAEVFRRMEELDLGDDGLPQPFTASSGNFRFIAGALLEFAAFGSYTEWHVFDGTTRTLTGRPVGWELSRYQPDGPVEGWDELLGYYQGRRKADG